MASSGISSFAHVLIVMLSQISCLECGWPSQNLNNLTSEQEFDLLADQYYVDQNLEKEQKAEMSDAAKENLKFYLALMAASSENPEQEQDFELKFENTTTTMMTIQPTTSRIRLPPELQKRKETYDEGIERLQCESPWFWNSFECVWLDVKNQNIIQRTKKNARTGAIFGGVVFALFAIPCCSCILMSIWLKRRVVKMERRSNDIVDKLRPGVFVHPDGTRHYYDPTPEEEEAFEDLLVAFASVV